MGHGPLKNCVWSLLQLLSQISTPWISYGGIYHATGRGSNHLLWELLEFGVVYTFQEHSGEVQSYARPCALFGFREAPRGKGKPLRKNSFHLGIRSMEGETVHQQLLLLHSGGDGHGVGKMIPLSLFLGRVTGL